MLMVKMRGLVDRNVQGGGCVRDRPQNPYCHDIVMVTTLISRQVSPLDARDRFQSLWQRIPRKTLLTTFNQMSFQNAASGSPISFNG